MDYGKAFRVIRAAYHLQQAEMAKLLGVKPSFISLVESGKRNPSQATIKELAASLRIPTSLVLLLASDQQEIELHSERDVKLLSESLLRMLVEASSEISGRNSED